jgi:uncharacterized 2Fe-2S/4Fe-4S cluster protein (DUF4445 family)
MVKVRATFRPGGETVLVPPGTPVVEAAAMAGITLQTPCGGRGKCRQCRVLDRSPGGLTPPDDVEQAGLSAEELAAGVRLACRAQVSGDVVVEIPSDSLMVGGAILEAGLVKGAAPQPNVRMAAVSLDAPGLHDQRSDLRRVLDRVGRGACDHRADVRLLRELPARLRDSRFRLVAVTVGERLADLRTESEASQVYGCAVDIGTTTVVAYLVELGSGEVIATGSAHNPQGLHGADVVSRVEYADTGEAALDTLRREAVGVVNEVIGLACRKAGKVRRRDIYEVTIVGNTCMEHLFLGLSPRHIARAPYIPVIDEPLRLSARDAGLRINPGGEVFLLPNIAGWVGADTAGALLSSRLAHEPGPALALDMGTNGEVMLWSGQRTLVCSTAAGPAFEGAQIRDGMRAARGAIEHVRVAEGGVAVRTIEGAPAVGLCGSGLLDALAALLDLGVVDSAGRMADEAAAAALAPETRARLQGEGNDRCFVLVPAAEAGGGRDVALTQRDVRQLQLAKGAMRAGMEVLLGEAGLRAQDLERILLAGAFGSYIDRRSAVRVGLVPPLPLSQIVAVGNAAGAGAVLALTSLAEREAATRLARTAQHVELSSRPDFQMQFMETMLFPSG